MGKKSGALIYKMHMKGVDQVITIEEFRRLELIVAEIKDVQEHPNADKLYVLKVDTGGGEKQLVAGIRRSYTKEQLTGRKIVMVNNLEPAVIRGEKSEGMLLAASDENRLSILSLEADVAVGSVVR